MQLISVLIILFGRIENIFESIQFFYMTEDNCNQIQFQERTDNLFALPLPRPLRALLTYHELLISNDFGVKNKKPSENYKNHKSILSEELINALKSMSKQERMSNYLLISDYVFMFVHGKIQYPTQNQEDFQSEGYVKSNSGRGWKKKILTFDSINNILSITDPSSLKAKAYNLAYYLYRISKNEEFKGFVLEASDKRVNKDCRIVHIGFKDMNKFEELFAKIKGSIHFRQWELIKAMYQGDATTKNSVNSMRKQSFEISKINEKLFSAFDKKDRSTSSDGDKENKNHQKDKKSQQNDSRQQQNSLKEANLMNQKYTKPENAEKINLSELIDQGERVIEENQLYKIVRKAHGNFYLNMKVSETLESAFNKYRQLPSTEVEEFVEIDKNIFCIKNKRFSKLLRNRYFIVKIQEHLNEEERQMIVNFDPCSSQQYQIEQANKNSVKGILKSSAKFEQISTQVEVKIDIEMNNSGTLKNQQNEKLVLKYLNGIIERFKIEGKQTVIASIEEEKLQLPFVRECDLDVEIKEDQSIKIAHDLRKKYHILPVAKCLIPLDSEKQGLFSEQWVRENESQIKFTNQAVIQAQKGVFKYIVGKMGRNIISGKSVLNISLPVGIFSKESNLQRLLHSFRMATQLFEKTSELSPIKKLQLAGLFTISSSLLYLSQEKCFNPILGETAQVWIDGCPAYAEQISHHPPIAAIYFVGRGFKIYGTLETKVELHLNSGTGCNSGPITIQFEDGSKIVNFFPGGQVLGMAYGERKFRISGKSYHLMEGSGEYLEISYENNSNSLFSSSKQKGVNGKFYKTDSKEIQNFIHNRKFIHKSKHNQMLHSILGSWHHQIKNNEELQIFDFSSATPAVMKREVNPLPSDCVWREDICYRKMQRLEKAQQFKQKLEEKQRRDRKLRKDTHSE